MILEVFYRLNRCIASFTVFFQLAKYLGFKEAESYKRILRSTKQVPLQPDANEFTFTLGTKSAASRPEIKASKESDTDLTVVYISSKSS
jgi:hypothetical protein